MPDYEYGLHLSLFFQDGDQVYIQTHLTIERMAGLEESEPESSEVLSELPEVEQLGGATTVIMTLAFAKTVKKLGLAKVSVWVRGTIPEVVRPDTKEGFAVLTTEENCDVL